MLRPHQLDGLGLWELGRREVGFETDKFDELTRHRLIRRLIGILVRDVCESTAERLAQVNPKSVEELQRLPYNVVGHSDQMQEMVRELKRFLYEKMYRHYRVVRMAKKAEHFITELFNAYMSEPDMLPDSIRERWQEGESTLARVVCDYLAGMTDRFALQEYQRLFDPFTRP